jgi:hypothetical protein
MNNKNLADYITALTALAVRGDAVDADYRAAREALNALKTADSGYISNMEILTDSTDIEAMLAAIATTCNDAAYPADLYAALDAFSAARERRRDLADDYSDALADYRSDLDVARAALLQQNKVAL